MIKKQQPTKENGWLYQESEDGNRQFSRLVYLGINADEWQECTNEEKEQWEAEHTAQEPVEDIQEAEEVKED